MQGADIHDSTDHCPGAADAPSSISLVSFCALGHSVDVTIVLAMAKYLVLLALFVAFTDLYAFNLKSNSFVRMSSIKRRDRGGSMGISMKGDYVVVGQSGSAAETIILQLAKLNSDCTITGIFDQIPLSPNLLEAVNDSGNRKVSIYYSNDIEKSLNKFKVVGSSSTDISSILANKDIIVVADDGDERLRNEQRSRDYSSDARSTMEKLLKTMSSANVNSVYCVSTAAKKTAEDGGLPFKLFANVDISDQFKAFCAKGGKKFASLKYGKLVGGVPGAEPTPFIGLPALEPELDSSYVLKSLVLTSAENNQYAGIEICTRDTLAEATARYVIKGVFTDVECLIVSIAGDPPTEKEWEQSFIRISPSTDAKIMSIEFGEILKPQLLVSWLVEQWFPQALIDADTATILTGARPVRAVKTSDSSVRLVWENIQSDLSVKIVGGLDIVLNQGSPPSLDVKRQSARALPGEILLVDRLVEGVNKYVYKRKICTPAADSKMKM